MATERQGISAFLTAAKAQQSEHEADDQTKVLLAAAQRDGPTAMSELIAVTGMTLGDLTRTTNELVAVHLIKVGSKGVEVTSEGKKTAKALSKVPA